MSSNDNDANKPFRRRKVYPKYSGKTLPEYTGNPFIEALPPNLLDGSGLIEQMLKNNPKNRKNRRPKC